MSYNGDCTRCHGDGEIEKDDDYGLGVSRFVTCWLCHGTGESGYKIEEDDEEEEQDARKT